MKKIITRFAPSPTGSLHIGGARTALFNYLFAKANGGKFLLRIEDTDKDRSYKEAYEVILNGMSWMGLSFDGDAIRQSQREDIHRKYAYQLLEQGKAYRCWVKDKEKYRNAKGYFVSPFRDSNEEAEGEYVIRLKVPAGQIVQIKDGVQGVVEVSTEEIDDVILLRSDGSPTYMLAVVVDDHEMGITHIIRGDDHLSNAFKQKLIYEALGWEMPVNAHIPLIHGSDGKKLSKRHAACSIMEYKDMGFLPEALNNYLFRLGWSYGEEEIISMKEAIKVFSISDINKSPACLDYDKMLYINAHYIRSMSDEELLKIIEPSFSGPIDYAKNSLDSIKERSKVIPDIIENARIYDMEHRIHIDPDNLNVITSNSKNIYIVKDILNNLEGFERSEISSELKKLSKTLGVKLGQLMLPIRILLTGKQDSIGAFEIMSVIGKDNTMRRFNENGFK